MEKICNTVEVTLEDGKTIVLSNVDGFQFTDEFIENVRFQLFTLGRSLLDAVQVKITDTWDREH